MMIYIFRHAQKAMDFSGDPDLTEAGHSQARRLLKKTQEGSLPKPTQVWSSPRLRAQSTLRPLSRDLRLPLRIEENLAEQRSDEDLQSFRQRVRQVLTEIPLGNDEVVFVCSHYDWVVEAMNVITCDKDLSGSEFHHWAPAQYAGFKVEPSGRYEFIEFERIPL